MVKHIENIIFKAQDYNQLYCKLYFEIFLHLPMIIWISITKTKMNERILQIKCLFCIRQCFSICKREISIWSNHFQEETTHHSSFPINLFTFCILTMTFYIEMSDLENKNGKRKISLFFFFWLEITITY